MWHSFEVQMLLFPVELLRLLLCVGLIGDFVIPSNVVVLTCVGEENRLLYGSELLPASPFVGPSGSLSSPVDLFSHAVKLNHTHYYSFLEAASSVALGCVNQLCWFYVVGYICDKRKFWSNPKSQWFPKAGHPQFVTAHMCWTQTWQLNYYLLQAAFLYQTRPLSCASSQQF